MHRSERGQVLVLFAGGIVALLLVAALAFDVGMMLLERRDEQNAADAAALAAADGMALGDGTVRACARARRTAADNGAQLLSCADRNSGMQVLVALGRARAAARAEFYRSPAMTASRARAARLSRYSFQFPHFGDWTHDGQPSSHGQAARRSRVART